jgi:hypothetical protein
MSDVDAIAEHIREIGEKMVDDYQPASDVVLDKKHGIIPRCIALTATVSTACGAHSELSHDEIDSSA